ncbi:MAG: prepilin peptidase, partial [Planctomycetes bacterium]|nr:prepilin peptidase [Planctomycetota bacterium]
MGILNLNSLVLGLVGLIVGWVLSVWFERLSFRCRTEFGITPQRAPFRFWRQLTVTIITALFFACFAWAELSFHVLNTPEVQPSGFARHLRLYYHLTLVSLMIIATAIDFDCTVIPDQITIPGMIIGLAGAFASGELQICHLWVDWAMAVPGLSGPGIPGWYDQHRHLHGLAWSATGMFAGATITFIARALSSKVLGQEAMGFGDVTFMAMIGSFIGWQAVVMVFLAAPLAGLTVGVLIKLLSGRSYLPYGPWLALGTVFVILSW